MIRINPAFDAGSLAGQFKRARGRLQIRDFLAAEDAEWTYDQLANHTPWGLVYNVGGRVEELSHEQLIRLPAEQLHQLAGGVIERAKTQYQFLYHVYPITGEYFKRGNHADPQGLRVPQQGRHARLSAHPHRPAGY